MEWNRRQDLEGGKELGIWLLRDETGTVHEELYVESHQYRGDDFDVYTATPEGEWTHRGEFEEVIDAFDSALNYIEQSGHPLRSPMTNG
ncbi:hypothetical protein K0C01_11420 [Salinarchaeum sp. IM2453]|uniref:hypothetical protein n=1 Tax=Salinarchaeum sp. IM2453 TaxID=2862870 RepID=UPI001C83683E|nr:hypothetical protein [Salinarchaeum sp. IM2453]QZA88380.1 hypothetical protein K0C01_11420 [Salinarchaeum sp. IM2453]